MCARCAGLPGWAWGRGAGLGPGGGRGARGSDVSLVTEQHWRPDLSSMASTSPAESGGRGKINVRIDSVDISSCFDSGLCHTGLLFIAC